MAASNNTVPPSSFFPFCTPWGVMWLSVMNWKSSQRYLGVGGPCSWRLIGMGESGAEGTVVIGGLVLVSFQ